MVAQALTNAGVLRHYIDTQLSQVLAIADTGQLKNLGRQQSAGTQHDFALAGKIRRPAFDSTSNAHGAVAIEQNTVDKSTGHHLKIGSCKHRVQKRSGGTHPPTVLDGVRVVAHALLVFGIEVLYPWQAHLLARAHHRFADRVTKLAGADVQRTTGPAHFISAQLVVFNSPEGGFHRLPAPFGTRLLLPDVIILRLSAYIDHAVDGA
ncbi:hypothetical protein D3C76_716810 [compost metagenome]